MRESDIPTELAGLTEFFRPGKPFSTAELQRLGGRYTESAIRGMDNYLDSISKQIFHIDSVQRGRMIEKYIRNAGKEGKANLPNVAANLTEWTNLLSGKKSTFDRAFESLLGRPFYSAMNWLRSRTSSNMILGNISSAMTNFIPLTQFLATTRKPSVIRGIFESFVSPLKKSFFEINGLESNFLIRRYPEKTVSPTTWQSTKNLLGFLFQTIDKFTAKSIISGKFFEGLSKGLSPQEAIKSADIYAGKILADRSIGQLPNLMGSRSLGVITQFQTEINNMYSFLIRDMPNLAEHKKLKILSSITQFVVYSHLFNQIYQKITGRRVSFDPLWAGLTMAGLTEEGENQPVGTRLTRAGEETLGNLPFTGGITSGRFPISAGIPNVTGLLKGETTIGKELVKPAAFIASPAAGLQIKKSFEGLHDYFAKKAVTKAGKTKYKIKQTPSNLIKGGVFGRYSFPEAKKYFNELGAKKKTKFKMPY
jgi:hypothetical protein